MRRHYRQPIRALAHNHGEAEMEKIIGGSLGIIAGVALAFGAIWLYHWGYLFVVPYFFPDGPERLIRPDYWPFAGLWIGIGLVARLVFRK